MLRRNLDTEESRTFWANIAQSAAAAEKLPRWASAGVDLNEDDHGDWPSWLDDTDDRRFCERCDGTGVTDVHGTLCAVCAGVGRVW